MLERAEELKQWVRETPLNNRLDDARRRIGKMCSEGRPPRMTIPVQHDDDDFYISTTLADAQATIADLQGQVERLEETVIIRTREAQEEKRLHKEFADMYYQASERETALQQRVAQLEGDVEEQKRNYLNACETIYKMYVAATGREGVAPKRGVVEDLADLQGQLLEWKRALHSLTPGGSEYANDSKACVEWVREARSRQHEAIIDGVKQRKDLQQRVAQLEQDSKKASTDYEACRNALDKTVGELTTLQADHARVLGVAEMYRKALSLISVKTTPWFEGHHGTVEDILAAYASYVLKEAASLTSEAAREGGSDESAV